MKVETKFDVGQKVFLVYRKDSSSTRCAKCQGSGSYSWEDDWGGYRSSDCNPCGRSGWITTKIKPVFLYTPTIITRIVLDPNVSYELDIKQGTMFNPFAKMLTSEDTLFKLERSAKARCAKLNKE